MKVTVVYNKERDKYVPFKYNNIGEILITSMDSYYNEDNCIVSVIEMDEKSIKTDSLRFYLINEGMVAE